MTRRNKKIYILIFFTYTKRRVSSRLELPMSGKIILLCGHRIMDYEVMDHENPVCPVERCGKPIDKKDWDTITGKCLICLVEEEDVTKPTLISLPCPATHKIHPMCLKKWYIDNPDQNGCPQCRAKIETLWVIEACGLKNKLGPELLHRLPKKDAIWLLWMMTWDFILLLLRVGFGLFVFFLFSALILSVLRDFFSEGKYFAQSLSTRARM